MKFFLAETFKAGEIPFWCANYFCGTPFMSDIQSGVFYPVSILFLLFPFPLSFNLFITIHFLLGFCFFYLFIVSLGLSRKTALLVSISYCYGGYVFATINTLNNLTTGIWLPAILWAFTRAVARSSYLFYGLTVLFIAAAILGGEPQLFILMGGILFLYAVSTGTGASERAPTGLKYGFLVILLGIWAVLMTMVQLGPTYMDFHHSARMGGLSYEEAGRFSLSVPMLKHLIVPIHFDESFSSAADTLRNFFPGQGEIPWLLTIYPGVIIFPLALLGAISSCSKRTVIWPILFLLSILLALGANTPIHYLFYKILPVFRFPEKFMFVAGFSLLVMSAYGFEKVFKTLKNGRTVVFWFLAIGLMLDLYANHRHMNPTCQWDFYNYHHPALKPILNDPGLFRVFADEMPTPPEIQNSINNHHIKWQMMLLPNLGVLNKLYHVEGVPALELRYQHQIKEILSKPWKEKIRFLRLANVKYVISQEPLDRDPDLKEHVEKVNDLVYRIKGFVPRAWVVGKVRKIKEGTVEMLINGSFDPKESVLGEISFDHTENGVPYGEIDRIAYDQNGRIQILARLLKPGILILSESTYPGWKVSVNGRESACLWLDLLFQGVALDAGEHHIVFHFRPQHFTFFSWVTIVSSSVFLFLGVFLGVRKGFLRPSTWRRSKG